MKNFLLFLALSTTAFAQVTLGPGAINCEEFLK